MKSHSLQITSINWSFSLWLLEERYIELFFFGNKAEQIRNFFYIFIEFTLIKSFKIYGFSPSM